MNILSEKNLTDAQTIINYLKIPENEKEYNIMLESMHNILDLTGGDEAHELSPILSMIAYLIEPFEKRHFDMF